MFGPRRPTRSPAWTTPAPADEIGGTPRGYGGRSPRSEGFVQTSVGSDRREGGPQDQRGGFVQNPQIKVGSRTGSPFSREAPDGRVRGVSQGPGTAAPA